MIIKIKLVRDTKFLMNKKKLLILGSTGFIGKNLWNFFEKKEDYILQHWPIIDLTKKEDVKRLFDTMMPDIVIHAAAVTTGSKDVIEQPWLHITDNVIMNALVFEACHKYNVKHCVWFSCSVPYKSSDSPQKESDWKIEDIPPVYFGVGNMKVYSEKLCEFYGGLGNCKYTAIRHSNVMGPYDKFDLDKCHLLPAMIRKVVEASNTLEVWGDGKAKRDLLYIDDLVDFVDKVIQKQESSYELFNCGSGKAYSINTIIDIISKIEGKKLEIIYNNSKPNIPTVTILNIDKAKLVLGWEPKTKLEDGIKKTLEYYKNDYKSD